MKEKTKMSNDTITINDVEYDVAEMTDNQKYAVAQVRAINATINQKNFELDQLRAAHDSFARVLLDSVATGEESGEES
jgi:hypothetical protein